MARFESSSKFVSSLWFHSSTDGCAHGAVSWLKMFIKTQEISRTYPALGDAVCKEKNKPVEDKQQDKKSRYSEI